MKLSFNIRSFFEVQFCGFRQQERIRNLGKLQVALCSRQAASADSVDALLAARGPSRARSGASSEQEIWMPSGANDGGFFQSMAESMEARAQIRGHAMPEE